VEPAFSRVPEPSLAQVSSNTTTCPLLPPTRHSLQVAYNVPVLPLLILQTLFDERFDAKYGSSRAYVFRLSISMVVMAGCLMIVIPRDQTLVLISAALVGMFDAVAFGTASQLFSMFPQACSGYYFIGSSLTSVVSIALTFATGFDKEEPSSASLTAFYVVAALFILIGLAAALTLIFSRIGRFYLEAKDAALAAAERAKVHGDAELSAARMAQLQGGGGKGKAAGGAGVDSRPLLASEDGSTAAAGADGFLAVGGATAAELAPPKTSNTDLLRYTLLCHIALFLCWTGTNTVDSMIAFVPSQSDTPAQDNQGFRLIMLYASLGGELLGKQLNLLRRGRILRGPKGLLVAVSIRTLMLLPFLLYILQPLYTAAGTFGFRVDGLIVTFQVLFDASGAYFSSLSYGMAPALLPHPSLRAQSSTLLAITLMLGVYLGLGISLGIAHRLGDVPRDALA